MASHRYMLDDGIDVGVDVTDQQDLRALHISRPSATLQCRADSDLPAAPSSVVKGRGTPSIAAMKEFLEKMRQHFSAMHALSSGLS